MNPIFRSLFVFLFIFVSSAMAARDYEPHTSSNLLKEMLPIGGEAPWRPGPQDNLKIGAGKVDVTPDRPIPLWGFGGRDAVPFEDVYEPVHIKVLTIEDGANRVVMLTAEILNWQREVAEEFRKRLNERYGLEPHQIILNASHTHCGPSLGVEDYRERFISSGVELVGKAFSEAQPARLYFGRGRSEIAANRRGLTREGFFVRQINPYGQTDHELIVLKAVNSMGRPLAFAVNYACHPTTLSGHLLGGDFVGVAMRMLEDRVRWPADARDPIPHPTGDPVALFLQGTGGDQKVPNRRSDNPHRFGYEGGVPRVNAFAETFLNDIVRTLETATWEQVYGPLSTKMDTVDLPLMASVVEAEGKDFEPFTGPKRRMARLAKMMLEAMDENGNYKETRTSEVHVLEIGDYVQVGLNGEVDVPIGLRIKAQLLGRPVLVTSYTGPSIGYFPGYCQIPEAGYEARTPYSPEAEDYLVDKAMELISVGSEERFR